MARSGRSHFIPVFLVLGFGVLIGTILTLVKVASEYGVGAASFAFVQAAGAGLIILGICLIRGEHLLFDDANRRFYAISGLSGIALPNMLLFLSVPHLGAGLTSLIYCFPPLATLMFALGLGMEKANPWRIAGLFVGFIATLLIALPENGIDADPLWLGVAMCAPLSLAFGNVYRSRAWPAGSSPMSLAAGMLLAGALWLVPLLPFADIGRTMNGPALSLLAVVILVNAVAYIIFLYLQKIAGPVYLGQVGYVNAASGLAIGVIVLGEQYSNWVWMAVAGVFAGVMLTTMPVFLFRPKSKK